MKPGLSVFTLIITLMLVLVVPARSEDRGAEIAAFAAALASDNVETRITALRQISTSGLSDRSLFEQVRAQLLEGYQKELTDNREIDELAWMCKALAASGNPDYRETLVQVGRRASVKKTRINARKSLLLLDGYAQVQGQVSAPSPETEGLSEEAGRIVKLLRTANVKMKREAAKAITIADFPEPKVFAVANDELLALLQKPSPSRDELDTMAWLCKALAVSGEDQYRPSLEEVIKRGESKATPTTDFFSGQAQTPAGDDTLRKYARQSLVILDNNAKRNALMAVATPETTGLSPEAGRVINLLRAADMKMKRAGARMAAGSLAMEAKVFEVANEELLALIRKQAPSREEADTMAWLCKALGASGEAKFRPTLETVLGDQTTTPDPEAQASPAWEDTLRKSAKQSLALLD